MQRITISEFKATCLAKLDQVNRTGEALYITRRGELIAQVLPPPLPPKPGSWLGSFASTGQITGDIVAPIVSTDEWQVLGS